MTAIVGLSLATAWSSGCQLLINPFVDELKYQEPVTTPSVELSLAHEGEAWNAARRGEQIDSPYVDGSVLHAPLYFEDPFEDKGSDDGQFAWTAEDYMFLIAWPHRYLLNGAFMPVSLVAIPPTRIMVSDGHLSRQIPGYWHDATFADESRIEIGRSVSVRREPDRNESGGTEPGGTEPVGTEPDGKKPEGDKHKANGPQEMVPVESAP
ncbi:MAG: hypothetical protein ACYTHJ_11990 [Planctomycetota bacterium]|jgi:hypothetical protein